MADVIILTHGGLAQSLYESVGLFVAEREGLKFLGMDVDTDGFRARLREALVESPAREILVLADLFGGTPFNMTAAMLSEAKSRGKQVEIVSGVSLPMLLEVTLNLPYSGLQELKTMAFESGKAGIRDLLAELNEKEVE